MKSSIAHPFSHFVAIKKRKTVHAFSLNLRHVSLLNCTMPKAKEEGKGKDAPVEELGPYSDPEILHKNYVKECAAIGIEAYSPVKDALTNVDNPNRGKQILILQQSKVGGNCLGPDGCRALVNAIIAQPFTAAKDIRISSNIKDSGAAALGKLLAATTKKPSIQPPDPSATQPIWQIEYLELINNDIGRDGALALGRSLCVGMNKTLATLILDFNQTLGSDGLAALCKGLKTNSTLKRLSVRYCNIDERGGKPVGEILCYKRTGLISLDLTSNRLGCSGLRDISDGLVENTSLKTLRLADISVGQSDDDVKVLGMFAGVLVRHPTIIAIDVMHNHIGNIGGNILLPAVTENSRITDFKVDSRMDSELFKTLFRVSAPPPKKSKRVKETSSLN